MHRRTLLAAVPALAASALLGGCAHGTPTPAQVAIDVQTIDAGLAGALAGLPVGLIPAAQAAKVTAALTDLAIVARTIGTAETTAGAQPMVLRVETDVNALVAALAGLPLPAPASTAIQAAMVLLPVVEAAVGMMIAGAPLHPAMTPAQARATLRAAAKR